MKLIIKFFALFFVLNVWSQKNMDTIYGNPKLVFEKIEFKDRKIERLFRGIDGYGFISFLEPKKLLKIRHKKFYLDHRGTFVNYKKVFNKNGVAHTELWYDMDNDVKYEFRYTYNKNKGLVEKQIIKGKGYNLIKYAYNYNGKLKSSISIYSDKTDNYSYVVFDHDLVGNMIKISNYDEDGYSNSTYFEYDKNNNLRNKTDYIPNIKNNPTIILKDTISKFTLFKHDKKGVNLLSIESGSSKKEISKKYEYQYDSRSNLINEKYYYRSYDTTEYNNHKFSYNLNNLKTKEIISNSKDTNKTIIREFEYDQNGYITKLNYNEYGKKYIISYTYKFDSKRNWTEITKIINGEPLYVWTRKIKYY